MGVSQVWATGADYGGHPIPTDGRYSLIVALAPPAGLVLSSDTYYQQQDTTSSIPAAGRYERKRDPQKKERFLAFRSFIWITDILSVCSVVLQTGECATECFCLRCPPLKSNSGTTIATGQYLLLWRRYVFKDTHTKGKKMLHYDCVSLCGAESHQVRTVLSSRLPSLFLLST